MFDFIILRIADILKILIVARVVISFIPNWKNTSFANTIELVTEPVLGPLRDLIPTQKIGFDLSPVLALFLISGVARLFVVLF